MRSIFSDYLLRWFQSICFALIVALGYLLAGADDSAPAAPTGKSKEPAFPMYLGSFKDPLTGHLVTRVTGDRNAPIPNTENKWEGRTRSVYNLKQVWSADEKLLFLGIGGPLVLDGETYEVLHAWGPPESARGIQSRRT